jgi:5-methylcytosine-specific restriction endonuclease McrA
MRKRDRLSQERREYIQQQFSLQKTETHTIKFERNGEIYFSTQEGYEYIKNRDKIYFVCEHCGEEKKVNKESYKNNICHACKHKKEITGSLPEHIISVENKIAKCSMCGEVVSFDEMSSHSRKRFGIDKICKKCNAKKTREYNEKFPDKKREMNKRYYDNNKEALLGKAKEYYGSNKETLLEKSKEYYSKNKEKIKVRVAEYRKTPKGKVVKINSSNKRREKEKQGSINSDDLIFLRENINSCEICGCELNDSNVHLDHIIPLSIGGAHRINNVRYICSSCNLQRPRDGKDIINKFEELSYSFSLKERTKELKTLIEYNKENYKTSWLNKNVITFQEDVFYSKEKELWDDYEVRKRIWINRSKYADKHLSNITEKDLLRGFKISGEYYGYSHFNPLWIKSFILKYNVNSIFDPTGGWGHRLLGAWNIEYSYNDLSPEIYNNVLKLYDFVNSIYPSNNKEFTNYDATEYIPNKRFDAVFTCPPYHNIETYPSNNAIEIYEEWLNLFWRKIVNNSYEISKEYFCFVISNKMKEDLINISRERFVLIEEIPLKVSNSHFNNSSGETLIIMKKT